ncbi:transposase [Elysia marginata]|uniref:Transposase n=1 Tax=Elysia marginata TaxID=1093978 RepID=A0AAV4HNN5_9GAST|nr:transposase [Elysia marginata]
MGKETDPSCCVQDFKDERACLRYSSITVANMQHAVDILPLDTTMTATYYVHNILSQVKSAINEQRPKVSTSRTLLLHDNTGLHKARATTQSPRELGIQVLPHHAYRPDLALCDFWLFPILKDRLAKRKFDRIQDLAKAVN